MTRTDHLLVILAEECAEVAQAATKALRFGLDDIFYNGRTNKDRIIAEAADVFAVLELLISELPAPDLDVEAMVDAKKERIENWLEYSKSCGRLI